MLAEGLIRLMQTTGIPNGLKALGYGPADLDALTDRAFAQKRLVENTPRPVTREDLQGLFRASLYCW